jgi:hypothetical protein
MKILEFIQYFPHELSCKDHFKIQWKNQLFVKKCAYHKRYLA